MRKNIHHTRGPKNISSSNSSSLLNNVPVAQVKAGQYSRHGAIPAQPTRGPQMQPASRNRGMHACMQLVYTFSARQCVDSETGKQLVFPQSAQE